ncbi:MAG: hypothetical protein L3J71_02525 [Victivallaceae bacterium]|nr:hypothetical protein [Victivallaceae bacterium]
MKIIDKSLIDAFYKLKFDLGTNKEVAEKIHISQAHVGRILKGEVNYLEDKTWKRLKPIIKPFLYHKTEIVTHKETCPITGSEECPLDDPLLKMIMTDILAMDEVARRNLLAQLGEQKAKRSSELEGSLEHSKSA